MFEVSINSTKGSSQTESQYLTLSNIIENTPPKKFLLTTSFDHDDVLILIFSEMSFCAVNYAFLIQRCVTVLLSAKMVKMKVLNHVKS